MSEIGLDKLGQWPILQFAAALATFAAIVYAVIRGLRDKSVEPPHPRDLPEQRWYFDGPVAKALETLRDMRSTLFDIRDDVREFAKERREQHAENIKERREQHTEHMKAINDLRSRLPRRRGG
jgi:hypothetical protein